MAAPLASCAARGHGAEGVLVWASAELQQPVAINAAKAIARIEKKCRIK
jgi:hypothetical protein